MRQLGEAWARQPTVLKVVVAAIAAIASLNVIAELIASGEERGGVGEPSREEPARSSVSADPDGLGAYAELLERYGHPVARTGEDVADLDPDPDGVLVVLAENDLGRPQAERLREFVVAGGTLVLGPSSATGVNLLLQDPPLPGSGSPGDAVPIAGGLGEVQSVRVDGAGSWRAPGETTPLFGTLGGILLTEARIGGGTAYLLAEASPLENRLLDQADNALLGLELAGGDEREVTFAEAGEVAPERGLAALPSRWRIALIGLALAGALMLAARMRRIGPPEEPSQGLMPSRSAYVDALATTLARAPDREATGAMLQKAAAEKLPAAIRVGPDADSQTLRGAFEAAGLPPDQAGALTKPVETDEDAMLAAAGLAALSDKEVVR